ncbi:MAG: response regulator, partial [Myxococcota bacterium]
MTVHLRNTGVSDVPEYARHLILAVDDDQIAREKLKILMRRHGEFELLTAASGAEGLQQLARCDLEGRRPAVVVADYLMPEMNGVHFLAQVKNRWPGIQRLLLTGAADQFVLEEAINRGGIHHILNKPWHDRDLLSTLRSACEQSALQAENRRLMREMEDKNTELTQLNHQLEDLNNHLERLVEARTAQLRYAKQAWETTFDAIGDPVILLDDDYTILRANQALADHRAMKVTQMPGRKCHKLLANSDRICEGCPIETVRKTGQAANARISLAPVDTIFAASAFPISIANNIVTHMTDAARYVCVYRDVTDQEKLQSKLLQSEKMTALGVLSGAVAHEINNPLGGILAFAQIMMREVPEDDEKHQFLQHIEDSAVRCQKTVRNLLDFARF